MDAVFGTQPSTTPFNSGSEVEINLEEPVEGRQVRFHISYYLFEL